MKDNRPISVMAITLAFVARAEDPLPSWNEGTAKKAILAFVEAVTENQLTGRGTE
jgi:hypothetical protein